MRGPGGPNRKRREGVGVVAIFVFFVVLFFYLRNVFQHADDIRRRREARQQDDSDDALRRLAAEDDIESGAIGFEWSALKSRADRLRRSSADEQHAGNNRYPATPSPAETPSVASMKGTPLQSTKEAARLPQSASMPPSRSQQHDTSNATQSQDPRIHTSWSSRRDRYDAYLMSERDFPPPKHSEEDFLTALYRDVPEYTGDDAFFQTHGHIFSHIPSVQRILRQWQTINRDMRHGQRGGRWVVVHPVGQLCNRLVAITSAAVFAILTKRALLVDDGGFYAQSSDLFSDPGFSWVGTPEQLAAAGGGHYVTNPEGGVWPETEKLLCGLFDDVFPAATVEFSTNQYLVPYYSNNPHYRETLLRTFRGDDIFHPVTQFLFRPIPKLVEMRDAFVSSHFSGKFVVGLQVRSGGDFTDHFMTETDWDLYRACAEAVVPPSVDREHVVYFLATDTEQGRSAGRRSLRRWQRDGNRSSGSGASEVSIVTSTPQFLLSNHPEGVQMALLDLLLLAAADDRVMTAWSSYGYFAAGFSGLHGNLVVDEVSTSKLRAAPGDEQRFMGIPHKSDRRRQCVRLPTHQPCFHKFESWGASKTTCFTPEMVEREMLHGRYC